MTEQYPLNPTDSMLDRDERNQILENWQRITAYLNDLRRQLTKLAGDEEVDALLEAIENQITAAHQAELAALAAMQDADSATELALEATDLAEQKAQLANDKANLAQQKVEFIQAHEQQIEYFTGQSTNLQAQINQIVANGDSSPEAAQARVGVDDTVYPTLKARVDAEVNALDGKIGDKAEQSAVFAVAQQLAQTEQNINILDASKLPKLPTEKLEKIKTEIKKPSTFLYTLTNFKIFRTAFGEITHNFNSSNYVVGSVVRYVSKSNGSNYNDGLTPTTAYRTISLALQNGADKIYLDDGFYYFEEAFNANHINKSVSFIALNENPNVTITTVRPLSWSTVQGYDNVRKANRTLVASVYDRTNLTEEGDYKPLIKVNSLVECNNVDNSYFYDTNSDLYIHPFDNRAISENDQTIVAFLNTFNLKIVGNHQVYLKGIKFFGGNIGAVSIENTNSSERPLLVAEDCEFKYSNNGNGGFVTLGADSIAVRCLAARNFNDGFNYHKSNNVIPQALEIDCVGRHNGGGAGEHSDNGSTMHDGGKMLRINCVYYSNYGPNVADIDVGTQSWNLGCESSESITTVTSNKANYYIGHGHMWLDSCIGYDSLKAYRSMTGATLYLRNSLFDDGVRDVNASTVEAY